MGFWAVHGLFGGLAFILFLLFVPRLTLLFSVALSSIVAEYFVQPLGLAGGYSALLTFVLALSAWIGCLIYPRIGIAIIASLIYFQTNIVLVVGAWGISYIFFA